MVGSPSPLKSAGQGVVWLKDKSSIQTAPVVVVVLVVGTEVGVYLRTGCWGGSARVRAIPAAGFALAAAMTMTTAAPY